MFNFRLPKIFPTLDVSTKLTISIVISFALCVLSYLSIFHLAGRFGEVVGSLFYVLFGRGSFIIPLSFFASGVVLLRIQRNENFSQEVNSRLVWGFTFLILFLNGNLSLFFGVTDYTNMEQGGGLVGYILYPVLFKNFGAIGAFLLLFCIGLIGFFLISQMTFNRFLENIQEAFKDPSRFVDFIPDVFEFWKKPIDNKNNDNLDEDVPIENAKSNKSSIFRKNKIEPEINIPQNNVAIIDAAATPVNKEKTKLKPIFSFSAGNSDGVIDMNQSENTTLDWKLPPFDILKDNKTKIEPGGDIEGNKKLIKDTLAHFGIVVEMNETRIGPTVTQYTLKPANGVKLSAIDNLQRDLALALAATHIRIEAPISGQSLVGIEIPNTIKSQVRLRDIIQTHKFLNYEGDLALAVGQDVAGVNVVYSLAKMPHLLVAGATGSGKSVWINGLLLSLLYRYSPQELQLILVDMKRVELKLYDGVAHLLSRVITDADKAINALKWTVLEMDRRYKLLEEYGKRNIKDYNNFAKHQKIEALPYIVFVIDELGDLMMIAKAEVEPIIVRLTQMSRAVGIHLVLGTQRPDTHVVTGLIKANVPTRIAFAVASQIDSRVILDQAGAEKLLGQGDGLIMSPSSMRAMRFQGPNIEELEVRKCVDFLKRQADQNQNYNNLNHGVTEAPKGKINVPGMISKDDDESKDDVFEEARKLVIQYQKASASFLQQMMGIGYPKAARIIIQLEEMGIVGPQNGSKPRDVYSLPEDE